MTAVLKICTLGPVLNTVVRSDTGIWNESKPDTVSEIKSIRIRNAGQLRRYKMNNQNLGWEVRVPVSLRELKKKNFAQAPVAVNCVYIDIRRHQEGDAADVWGSLLHPQQQDHPQGHEGGQHSHHKTGTVTYFYRKITVIIFLCKRMQKSRGKIQESSKYLPYFAFMYGTGTGIRYAEENAYSIHR
jgi:hypothetical protein